MATPRQVLEEEEKAEKMFMESQNEEAGDREEESTDTAMPQEQPVEPQPQQPEPTPVVNEPSKNELMEELRKLREQHNSLKGKYDAEVPRLHNERKNLQQELERMKQVPVHTEKPEERLKKYYSENEIAEIGEEYANVIANVAERIADEKVKRVASQLEETNVNTFFNQLRQEIPGFDEINQNHEFVSWITQPNGFSDETIDDVLQKAAQRKDSKTIAKIFAKYQETKGTKPAQQQQTAKRSLESQIAPAKSTASSQVPSSKHIYSMNEFKTMMDNMTKGKYTREDAKKIELELDNAITEGRIR